MNQNTQSLSALQAATLITVITSATLLGLAYGKKMEKTIHHLEVPHRRRYSYHSLAENEV